MIWLIVCFGISADIQGGCVKTHHQTFKSEAACWRAAKKIDPDGFGKDSAYCTHRSPIGGSNEKG